MRDRYTVQFEQPHWIVIDTHDCGTVARVTTEADAMRIRLQLETQAKYRAGGPNYNHISNPDGL